MFGFGKGPGDHSESGVEILEDRMESNKLRNRKLLCSL